MAKLNEDGLVNATHTERLSQRNSEPSNLKGGSWDDLGGTGIDSEPNSVKIDAAKGVKGQDTSIIGAGQNSEKSHLKTEGDDDVDVDFGDDGDGDVDDIDKELDQFEDVEPVDVDVDMDDDKDIKEGDGGDDDDDEDDKFIKNESRRARRGRRLHEDEERGENNGEMEASAKGPEAAMNSGPNKVAEGELPPWLKKKGEEGDKEVNEDEIIIKKGDDDGDEKDEKKSDDDGEKKENPFAKKDDSEKVDESVHIKIRRPNVKLLEAAGLPAKAQKKVALIFESVIKDVTKQVANQIAAHYKKLHESKLAKRDVVLAKQMDAYLNYVVEEWVKTNRVPIRTALKSQLAEEFLSGFQRLMKEHYIEVPESKVNVVNVLTQQVAALKKSLNEQTANKMKYRRIAEAANKGRIVSDFTKTAKLSEAQSAKLAKLTEDVPYTNAKDFREKVGMLAESYFGGGEKKKALKVLPEEKIQLQEEKGRKVAADPDVEVIAQMLKRQAQSAKW